ncbi:MAG: hypothetical protein U0903_16890 [Planctomycetales bacterium]
MFLKLFGFKSASSSRRAIRKSAVSRALDVCEDRVLLSASSLGKAKPAVEAADFTGTWTVHSNVGDGDAVITQQGAGIKVHLTLNFQSFDVSCNTTDNHAKGKINTQFLGGPIVGKFVAELKDANTIEGHAKIKKSVEGRMKVNFEVTRAVGT